jgi:hypothetical protein
MKQEVQTFGIFPADLELSLRTIMMTTIRRCTNFQVIRLLLKTLGANLSAIQDTEGGSYEFSAQL